MQFKVPYENILKVILKYLAFVQKFIVEYFIKYLALDIMIFGINT